MWSSNIKPQVIEHGRPGKCNEFIYIINIYLSGTIVERHLFFNKRKYNSFLSHLRVFPLLSRYSTGLSISTYYDYFEEYDHLINFE